jgi:hypothetical protein
MHCYEKKVKKIPPTVLGLRVLKGEFAVVPTDKILWRSLSSKIRWYEQHIYETMSHDQRDLKVTYLKILNFRSDFCRF